MMKSYCRSGRGTARGVYVRSELTLERIRGDLIRGEDAIVFHLFTRKGLPRHSKLYDTTGLQLPHNVDSGNGPERSLLESVMQEFERTNAMLKNYRRFEDHPFFLNDGVISSELPASAAQTNVNAEVYRYYLKEILPRLMMEGDDEDYADTVMTDIQCLQALSRRIHHGKYVAEAKFRAEPERYTTLIEAEDGEGIMAALTDAEVEADVVERVRMKATRYDAPTGYADLVAEIYRDWVIPLTKEVEVEVLLNRFRPTKQ